MPILSLLFAAALAPWPAAQGSSVHLEATVLRRRALSRKLVFFDLQSDDGISTLQAMLRDSEAATQRHALIPGSRVAVLGTMRQDVETGQPTLVVQGLRLVRAAASEHAVTTLASAVRAGVTSVADAQAALAGSDHGQQAADAAVALLNSTPPPKAQQQRLVALLVNHLAESTSSSVVAIARSGGGHAHGLPSGRELPCLAFLYAQPDVAAALLSAAEEAGGAMAALAALDRTPLSALAAMSEASGPFEGSDGWVTVEAEVQRRQRLEDQSVAPERLVMISVGEGLSAPTRARNPPSPPSPLLRCLLHPAMALSTTAPPSPASAARRLVEEANYRATDEHLQPMLQPDDLIQPTGLLDCVRRRTMEALASPGARMTLVGRWAPASPHAASAVPGAVLGAVPSLVLIVFAMRLQRSSSAPRTVRAVLDALADGRLADDEAARALCAHDDDGGGNDGDDDDDDNDDDGAAACGAGTHAPPLTKLTRRLIASETMAQRAWRAAELAQRLQIRHPTVRLGPATLSDAQRAAVEACEELRQQHPLRRRALDRALQPMQAHEGQLPPRRAAAVPPLLEPSPQIRRLDPEVASRAANGADDGGAGDNCGKGVAFAGGAVPVRSGRDGSFFSIKKRPQLILMTDVIAELLSAHPDWGRRPLSVVDVGGGKGLLAEHLARHFGAQAVEVTLVELNERALAQVRARLDGRGTPLPSNLALIQGDAAQLAASGCLNAIDLVCGLHACGGLADVIMSHAVQQGAAFAVCTCCFCSNSGLALPHALPHALSRDVWLSRCSAGAVTEAQVETLRRTAELEGAALEARAAAHSVNAMRARAAAHAWAERWTSVPTAAGAQTLDSELRRRTPQLRVELVEFEAKFSGRNQVIVGMPEWHKR